MELISSLHDGRINAKSLLLESAVGEYLTIAKKILENNEFQRRRVKSSPTLYSLLKEDLLRGCVIPPIVLAFGGDGAAGVNEQDIDEFISAHGDELLILDGLQRTSSMLDLEAELLAKNDVDSLQRLRAHTLRLEVYVGINRLGVLYRMLTLNTGQTPMSLRQQVEILFLDYARIPMGDIRLVREAEDAAVDKIGKYAFKAVIEGFNSYLERNELPIDRYDLLESVKSLEKLSKENEQVNLFKEFVETYHQFVVKVNDLTNGETFSSAALDIDGQPFGIDARRIFSKEQALAGFGAGTAKLRDFNKIGSFYDVRESINNLFASTSPTEALASLLKRLEAIRLTAKKIGNSQRLFFHFYFREILNPEGDAFRDLSSAVEAAYRKYESQML
jgi:hypothetical protein